MAPVDWADWADMADEACDDWVIDRGTAAPKLAWNRNIIENGFDLINAFKPENWIPVLPLKTSSLGPKIQDPWQWRSSWCSFGHWRTWIGRSPFVGAEIQGAADAAQAEFLETRTGQAGFAVHPVVSALTT